MNSKQTYYVLCGLIVVLLVALIGGAYETNTLLTKRAITLTSLKAKQAALEQEQLSLTKAKKDITKYADLHKIAQAVVPEDKSQAEAVRQIVSIADSNKIKLGGITFPASTLGTIKGATTPAAGATVAPVVTSPSSGALSQLTPVVGAPGVYSLVISVQSDTSSPIAYTKFVNFLAALEHNRRTAQVSTIALTPDTENPNLLSFTLTLNEYIKP